MKTNIAKGLRGSQAKGLVGSHLVYW